MTIVRASALLITIVLVAAMPGEARAGDYYFTCATPGGSYELNADGELRSGDRVLKYRTLQKITIRQKEGICTAKDGGKYKWDSHTYLVELATRDADRDMTLMFLCDVGGSGVPANEAASACVSRTTLDKELRPAYRNRAK